MGSGFGLAGLALTACLRKPPADSSAGAPPAERAALDPKPAPAMPGVNVPAIKIDTVGFPADWTKTAIFNVAPTGAVIRTAEGRTAHTVSAEHVRHFGKDVASGDEVWQVDFTALTEPGRYVIEQGGTQSDPFEVGGGVYARPLALALKYFYFQRCRTALVEPYARFEGDSFTRESPCHAHADVAWDLDEYPDKKTRWKPEAGWHDAGNFEMYVPSTAPTAQALLMAYEAHPELFSDGQLDIPESKNGVPDILDEARWGLSWVLSVQDQSGGFRNREAVMLWGEHGPADGDKKAHWISGVGTASTAKAIAALAVASRVYRDRDSAFALRCEQAARRGWKFLLQHPDHLVVDPHGSEQPLWDDGPDHPDEGGSRLLAAAEMWKAFREPAALEQARQLLWDPQTKPGEFLHGAWVNLARWGLMTLALDPQTPEDVRLEAAARIQKAAESIRDVAAKDGYLVASTADDYYWGSNSNLMERTHILLVAHRLDPSRTWALGIARDQWHWLLGRNPNGYSMVTRVGRGPTRVYHLEWGRKDHVPPGMLVGGPNAKEGGFLAPGSPAKALLWDNPEPIIGPMRIPAHAMWHAEQVALWDGGFVRKNDWSVGWWIATEGDIYYNANLVLVATEMNAPPHAADAELPTDRAKVDPPAQASPRSPGRQH